MQSFNTLFSLTDFRRIPGMATAFDLPILEPYWLQVLDKLDGIVPSDHALWQAPDVADTPLLTKQRTALKVYAVYAIAAAWYLQGDVLITESGPVTKEREHSDELESVRRTELYRRYSGFADTALIELAGLLTPSSCAATMPVVGARVSVIAGANRSKF